MNHCQNFTNRLYLEPANYPAGSGTTYFVSQADVDKVISAGLFPEILLKDYTFATNAPKIAVLLTRDKHPDRLAPDYSMPISTIDAITISGGNPCFMTYTDVEMQLQKINPDGIYLPGGDFAFPSGWHKDESAHPAEEARAKAYLTCLNYAKKHKLPLLGICAGMQMLAGFCGAKIEKISNHRSKITEFAHKITVAPDSMLFKLMNKTDFAVNTSHSEAVSPEFIGECLISATSEDGIIEAVELKNPWNKFVMGIQSHPEYFVKTGDEFAVKLFSNFIKACKNEL